ncbi:MAG TPA: hypothetical protein VJ672_02070 [Gemmatimonadaceae bacterium]|nr:hypothetical protein [Gemmatimonadaceae bacterium]
MSDRLEVVGGVSVRFGPVVIRFDAVEPDVRFILRPPHTAFVVPDGVPADCTVTCHLSPPERLSGEPSFAPEEGDWELRRDPRGGDEMTYLALMNDGSRTPRLGIRIAPDFRSAEVRLRPREESDRGIPIDFPLDEYLATRLLGRRGDIPLHACLVAEGEDGFIFAGHSGAGKSTIAALAESAGAEVLSDDRTILEIDGDIVRGWGTPWHGSYKRGNPRSAVVRGVFLLVQDTMNEVRPLSQAAAFGELFVRTVQPTIVSSEVEKLVDSLERIVGMVPMATLHFRPTVEAYLASRKSVATLQPAG